MYLSLDIGSTLIKCIVFDEDNHEVKCFYKENNILNPSPHFYELDMNVVWKNVVDLLNNAYIFCNNSDLEIKVIGIAGNMVGFWPLDKNNQVYRNAILWNDGRSSDICKKWSGDGTIDEIFAISGNIASSGFTLSIIKWLKENDEESLNKCGCVLNCKDYIRFMLTGEKYLDYTEASHLPGSIFSRNINKEVLKIYDLEEYLYLFPDALESEAIAGYITKEAESIVFIKEGTPVIAGMGDVASMVIGARCINRGDNLLILGTSIICASTYDEPCLLPKNVGLNFVLPFNKYSRVFPNQSGMISINWLKKQFFNEEDDFNKLWDIKAGSEGLIVHPYLSSTGILAPCYSPKQRGCIEGLSLMHTKYHIAKAMYEGLAFSIRECFELFDHEIEEITVVGGGSNDERFCQLIADITGCKLKTIKESEVGALGISYLCKIQNSKDHNNFEILNEQKEYSVEYIPNKNLYEFYNVIYKKYLTFNKDK